MNIEKMIITSDFSELLNSTQIDRDSYGGNQTLYNKLANCVCLDLVKQVALETFKDDHSIIEQIERDYTKLHKDKSCSLSDTDIYQDIVF